MDSSTKDFSGKELIGKDFNGQNLVEFDFSEADLTEATLSEADCSRTVFYRARLREAQAVKSCFRGAVTVPTLPFTRWTWRVWDRGSCARTMLP